MKRESGIRVGWVIGVASAVVAWSDASANMGVPMLALVMPWSWWLLIPIILVEAVIAKSALSAGWRQSLKVSAIANGISTIVGVPITWFVLLFLDFGLHKLRHVAPAGLIAALRSPLQIVWIPPYYPEQPWLYPLAGAGLCVPFFLASVLVEYRAARWLGGAPGRGATLRWAWLANAVSYGVIAAALLAWGIYRRLAV